MGGRRRPPGGLVELLRLLIVVFFAGAGYEVSRAAGPSTGGSVLGPFNAVAIGIIVGSGLGYVLGGVVARSTVAAVERTEVGLRGVSAETLVASGIGGVVGVLLGVGLALPVLFLLREPFLAYPLFGFVVAVLGYVGYRVGLGRRDSMLAMFGDRAGIAPSPPVRSTLPRVVDSSVAIDGRVLDIVRAGFLHGQMWVLPAVLGELQGLADAADPLRRARGRRGLEVLEALRREAGVEVVALDDGVPGVAEVDAKLVRVCLDRGAALLTLDTNLAKAAGLAGAQVLNLHALALALRPPVTAGEEVTVLLLKPGREPGQAVGYLDDGTMVVAERSRPALGRDARLLVTSVLTTANGRMVFAVPVQDPAGTVAAAGDARAAPTPPPTTAPSPRAATPASMPSRRSVSP